MKELSIFIDESGDFGAADLNSPYYLVTLVFHDQDNSIGDIIDKLKASVLNSGFDDTFIHSGPLIRREHPYKYMKIDPRRSLIYKMRSFYLSAPISHATIVVDKRHFDDKFGLNRGLAKSLNEIIEDKLQYFLSFDKVIVYYDNGQQELNMIINTVIGLKLGCVEFRKASQSEYRLLQLTDFVCTMELLKIKLNEKRLSKSEESFFYKPQELKKTFIKILKNKLL